MSVPFSKYIIGRIPWYSFLIVFGASLAVFLGVREEKRTTLKKDTFLDFVLIALPAGILGARIYYVIFSWDQFKNNLISIFKIWEGGIAIYGAVIAGLLAALLFSRKRKISVWTLCDLAAPGLVLAQSIGRWGNYFNQEAYGLPLTNTLLCFFPLAVQIPGNSGLQWHMATFFYESCWDFLVFIFLIVARRRMFRYNGDIFRFYALLYAAGRLIIEDYRMDSLYAVSSIRISQLLSILICALILAFYAGKFRKHPFFHYPYVKFPVYFAFAADSIAALWLMNVFPYISPIFLRTLLLLTVSALNITVLLCLYSKCAEGKIIYAHIH